MDTQHINSSLATKTLKRTDFPTLQVEHAPAFLDSAASSLKPQVVIDRMQQYYSYEHANVHRGVYALSELATASFESARKILAQFVGDVPAHEVIFTRGTTDSLNLLANCLSQHHIQAGDEIVLTVSEHHSNIVPWQIIAERTGAVLRYIPLNEDLTLNMTVAEEMITSKTKVVSFAHASNVLGSIHPVKRLCQLAKQHRAITIVDGAQGVPHLQIDVKELGCDAYVFSGHKMLGPTGIGVLWATEELLSRLPPYQGGGDMIESVTLQGSTWNKLPYKFEAGTPPIAEAIALGTAAEALMDFHKSSQEDKSLQLAHDLVKSLQDFKNIKVYKPEGPWTGVVSFTHDKVHPHDMAAIQDSHGVCVRAGHHCAQPLMMYLGVNALVRVSPYLYNNNDDTQRFLNALEAADAMFKDAT
ncbi:MAG: aminotransferase class V-fold PLP-dependent enzyme [Oligoflexales bacterium]